MIILLLTKGNDKRLNKKAEKSRIKTQKVGLHKRQINEVIEVKAERKECGQVG